MRCTSMLEEEVYVEQPADYEEGGPVMSSSNLKPFQHLNNSASFFTKILSCSCICLKAALYSKRYKTAKGYQAATSGW